MLLPFHTPNRIEAGCDEAGRGCLAGPVCAAAVILPSNFYHPLLNDSKKLTEAIRNVLRPIIEKEAIAYAVAFVNHKKIDQINILQASFKAMHLAVDQLGLKPEQLLIDGNRFVKYPQIPHTCIIKGDGKYASIAAASILAKTYRDEYMQKLDKKFPVYGWQQNKGYPTLAHREAIRLNGLSPFHRKTFACLPKQMELFKDEKLQD
jgi:ribonuclease HII